MQGIIHPYYMVALAPAIGALVGVGGMALWQRNLGWPGRGAVAVGVLVTAWWAYQLLDRSPSWLPWLRWLIAASGVLAVIAIMGVGLLGRLGWLGLSGRPGSRPAPGQSAQVSGVPGAFASAGYPDSADSPGSASASADSPDPDSARP